MNFLQKNHEKMGWFEDSLKSGAGSLIGGLGGGLGSAISGAIGGLFGPSPAKQMRMQKQLMQHQAQLSYEYGEKAANNTFRRNLQMYQRQFNDQSFETQRNLMEEAGLSVGLMYGGGGAGGGGGASTSGQPQGGANVSGGAAPNAAAFQAAATQQAQLGLSMLNMKRDADLKEAQTNELNARAEEARANASKATEEKITNVMSREDLIGELHERGTKLWLDNFFRKFNAATAPGEGGKESNWLYGDIIVNPESSYQMGRIVELAKELADAGRISAQENLFNSMILTEDRKQAELTSQVFANLTNGIATMTNANSNARVAAAAEGQAAAAQANVWNNLINALSNWRNADNKKEYNDIVRPFFAAKEKALRIANGDAATAKSIMEGAARFYSTIMGANAKGMDAALTALMFL